MSHPLPHRRTAAQPHSPTAAQPTSPTAAQPHSPTAPQPYPCPWSCPCPYACPWHACTRHGPEPSCARHLEVGLASAQIGSGHRKIARLKKSTFTLWPGQCTDRLGAQKGLGKRLEGKWLIKGKSRGRGRGGVASGGGARVGFCEGDGKGNIAYTGVSCNSYYISGSG